MYWILELFAWPPTKFWRLLFGRLFRSRLNALRASSAAKGKTTGRLEAGDFKLYDIESKTAKGLHTITKAMYESDTEVTEPASIAAAWKLYTGRDIDLAAQSPRQRNVRLACLIRDACVTGGWLAGWNLLLLACPNVGLNPRLVQDVNIGSSVYARLSRSSRKQQPIDIRMEVGPNAIYDSVYIVGPKSLGGTAWKESKEYAAVLERDTWRDKGYLKGFSPCIAYGWIAVQIKAVPAEVSPDTMRLQLLNTADYDLDYGDENKVGFENGFLMGAYHALKPGTLMQGAAYVGMLSYDFQTYVRTVQMQWVASKSGAWNNGFADASPSEFAATQVADCAALVPFGLESHSLYNRSRTGMITGMMQLQCHDLLFDTGCSNRVSTVAYSEACGVGKYNMHTAFTIGFYEAIGRYFLDSLLKDGEGVVPPYGYAACMIAGPWNPFNTRYRAWERCIKYSKQLQRSKYPEAKFVLELASKDLVLRDCDLSIEVGKEWARAVHSDMSDFVPRTAVSYFIPSIAHELFDSPGVPMPELCAKCGPKFEKLMRNPAKEEIRAIKDLPEIITSCRAAGLAAGIRRAVIWSCTDEPCDACASRIGCWTDATAYTVLSALMHDEPLVGPSTWSLQNYFVGAVTLWPIELPVLLGGFDMLAKMSFDDGAMGDRDIVDI
jgi:hypothetical protein